MSETPFTDLTLYDVDETDLVERAIQDMTLKVPGLEPRAGHTEVVLTEALALVVGELVYAINRVPGAVLDGVLALQDVERSQGLPAKGEVRFTLADTFSYTIPAGTTIRVAHTSTGEEVDLTTDLDTVVTGGVGVVEVTATVPGVAVNGLGDGAACELVDAIPYVERVEVGPAGLSGGTEVESDDEFYARARARLRRLSSALVLPDHYQAAAEEHVEVGRALVVDEYDPTDVGSNPGDSPGHVSVAVLSPTGTVLSAGVRSTIAANLSTATVAGMHVHVIDPTTTAVPVTASVTVAPGYTPGDVTAAVTAAVQGYLNSTRWEWGTAVYRNELISLIDQVPGVGRVASLTAPAADVSLSGPAAVATAGAVTITVAS